MEPARNACDTIHRTQTQLSSDSETADLQGLAGLVSAAGSLLQRPCLKQSRRQGLTPGLSTDSPHPLDTHCYTNINSFLFCFLRFVLCA